MQWSSGLERLDNDAEDHGFGSRLGPTSDWKTQQQISRPVAKAYSVILKTVSIRRRDYFLSFYFGKKSVPLPAF